MRFFTVFTLVCWVFLATVYLPIASADDGDDDDGSGAAPPAPGAGDDDGSGAGSNDTPPPEPTGTQKLMHFAASPSEFLPYLPPYHPKYFYFLSHLHGFYLLIFLFRCLRASQQPDARRMLRRGSEISDVK